MLDIRFKDLPKTASESDLVSGNYLVLDGENGTKKLPADLYAKNSVLVEMQDELNSFRYRSNGTNKVVINFTKGSYLSKSDGSLVENANGFYTDYVDITNDFYFCINAKTAALTCMVAIYDANKDFLASVGKNSSALDWNDVVISSADIKSQNPTAKYLRFGSFNKVGSYVYQMDSVYDSDSGFDALQKNVIGNKIEVTAKTTGTLGTPYAVTDGKFLAYTTGEERSSVHCQCTDYIDITEIGCFNVVGKSQYDVAIMCVYDGNKNFIASFGHTIGETVDWTNKKIFVEEVVSNYPLAKYVRFSSIFTALVVSVFTPANLDSVYDEVNGKIEGLSNTAYGSYEDTEIAHLATAGFIDKRNGNFTEYNNTTSTDYVDLYDYRGKVLAVTSMYNYNVCAMAVYDSSRNFIESYGKTADSTFHTWMVHKVDVDELIASNSSIRYARFSSFTSGDGRLAIFEFTPFEGDALVDDLLKSNSLYKKKWVACGDSFTHGGNVAVDPITGLHKSYPWWIATRNKMDLVMMAKSGETIHNRDDNTNEFTPTRYLSIPSDADIITLSWGLNETGVTIGDSSSSDDTTLWGAFNEVISFILANNPKCKIGIIIQDGWMTQTIADAEKAIGEYWGIPVLDLKFDKNVPLGIYGRPNVSTNAINARNSVFMDNSNHPTEEGHEYRSTFIENWMKTL